jgi:hypothetical protein
MKRVIGLAVVAALLAGCGSNQPTKAGFVRHALAQQVKYAQCMRTHGVPGFPDPTIKHEAQGTGISQGVPASVGQSPAFASANRACAKLAPQGGQGNGAPPRVTAAQHAQLVSFAACMRRHGTPNMPDPAPSGVFNLPSAINQNAPAFTSAIKGCLPNGVPLSLNEGP